MYNDVNKLFKIAGISADKYSIKRDMEYASKVSYMDTAYFFVALPCNYNRYSFYHQPKTVSYNEWKDKIEPLKPNTPYMSLAVFKVVKYTPVSTSGGFISSVKAVPPSLIVQTMDGRTIEAYKYVKEPGSGKVEGYITLSDAVLAEVRKNFVHPRLTLNNFTKYSEYNSSYGNRVYVVQAIADTDNVSPMFSQWKDHKHEVRKHLDTVMAEDAKEELRRAEEVRKAQERTAKYKNDLESAFGSGYSSGGNSSSNNNFDVYYCPTCRTGCRIPVRGKKTEITCPKCGRKFTVFC